MEDRYLLATKICTKCGEEKPLSQFNKDKHHFDGFTSSCKKCRSEYAKEYHKQNAEKRIASYRAWASNNKEYVKSKTREYYEAHIDQIKEYDRKRYSENIDKHRENSRKYRMEHLEERLKKGREHYAQNKKYYSDWQSNKRKSDPTYRLNHNISNHIRISLQGNKAGRSWEKLVGYTLSQLKTHLEKQFTEGMSWDNYGQWHIDHIIPKTAFNYSTAECIDFKRCWSLKNLRPLWSLDNFSKSNKLMKHFQPALRIAV